MKTDDQIGQYLAAQPEPKRRDLAELHRIVLELMPGCKLWYLDGKDESGKVVSNPNIGYGSRTSRNADGKSREFYQVGISANTTGISVYILGISDKKYLSQTFGERIGKAKVTGYCIKFRKLGEVNVEVLKEAIRQGFASPSEVTTSPADNEGRKTT